MPERAREERPAEARDDAVVVRVLDREPVQPEAEQVEPEQRREKGGKGAQHHEDRHGHAVDGAAAAPRREHSDARADEEREHEGDADQEHRVRQRPADHLRHGRRVVRRRDAEVEVRDPVQVGDVVLPDRVVAAAEQRLVGLDDSRIGGELRGRQVLEQAAERAPRHEPREQEVDRQRDPDREDVEGEPTGEPAHVLGRVDPAGGRGKPPAGEGSLPDAHAPARPPGQMRVNESELSGNVVKIGSP